MSGDKEYIIDIVEEIRDYAEHRDFDSDGNVSTTMLRVFAARIEAAWRREKNAPELKSPSASQVSPMPVNDAHIIPQIGNAAAMREAAEKCVDLILSFGNAELDETPLEVIIDIEAILKAALAAPPKPLRNCERYSHDEALEIWAAEKENGYNGCFDEWLYATAKKEGGAE